MSAYKLYLTGLILVLSLTSYSQPSTIDYSKYVVVGGDTLLEKFPVKTLRKIMIAAERSKELKLQVDSFNAQVNYYDSLIRVYEGKDTLQKKYCESQKANLIQQHTVLLNSIEVLKKEVRREKRKRRWATFGGILTTGAMTYLIITK